MYAMGLLGLLLAGLIALGAALGLFSGPDGTSAVRLTAEGYVLTRSASLDAVRDAAVRSQDPALAGQAVLAHAVGDSGNVCLAPWTADDACAISLTDAEREAFASPGWIAPTRGDGSPRWLVRLEGNEVYVYGPADAADMAAIRNILRYPEGLAWCPPGSADGAACTPPSGPPAVRRNPGRPAPAARSEGRRRKICGFRRRTGPVTRHSPETAPVPNFV